MKYLALCLMLGIATFWLGRVTAVVDPPIVILPTDMPGDSCIMGSAPLSSTVSNLVPGQIYWVYMATFDPKKVIERSKQ